MMTRVHFGCYWEVGTLAGIQDRGWRAESLKAWRSPPAIIRPSECEGDEDRGIDGRDCLRQEHRLQSLQIPRRSRRRRRPRRLRCSKKGHWGLEKGCSGIWR